MNLNFQYETLIGYLIISAELPSLKLHSSIDRVVAHKVSANSKEFLTAMSFRPADDTAQIKLRHLAIERDRG
jgi:hypothetical protein